MQKELVSPFTESLTSVYDTMVGVELRPGKSRVKNHHKSSGAVTGLIGMNSPQTSGSLSISFDQGIAIETMSRLVGEAPSGLDCEVLDMIGEVTNMVAGGAKNILEQQGYDFGLDTPSMLIGEGHEVVHPYGGTVFQLMFETDFGDIAMEVSFQS